ncbi:NmrA family NAD(P)-binding protein [Flavobacterium soyangense]|uniref:NmrA family NAD(P)-binding protein n=1 Tax=Flavobacterium soyangense TaxID=2023265 RepID=A0A930Y118_9FLAO|nr:NmrA family NAD(P)-binding protein [Flavobacterium soyangense]MBF2708994.1 NmrA family NAD(P)-binding protein [Flavobacterium soyangense]
MYVITGATGNTGKIIASTLLEAGKKVRIISRSAEKAKELTDKGAELFIGETSDAEFLKKAFDGATAVYAMIPVDWQTSNYTEGQVEHANAIAEALRANQVKYVVALSSQGAHLESGSGVVLGLHKMENIFNKIEGLNALHLRPSYFMENTLGMIGLVKQAGIMGSPIKADLSFPVIATKDIANYAAKRLLSLDFENHSIQNLLGAREVTYPEIAKVYGQAIGINDLQYVEFSPEDFKNAMMQQMGTSENVADTLNEFIGALNVGKVLALATRDAESTTPTTIEEFAQTFNYVYNM